VPVQQGGKRPFGRQLRLGPSILIKGPTAPPRAAVGGGQECNSVRVTHLSAEYTAP